MVTGWLLDSYYWLLWSDLIVEQPDYIGAGQLLLILTPLLRVKQESLKPAFPQSAADYYQGLSDKDRC